MAHLKQYSKRQKKARQRRFPQECERLQREQAWAQHHQQALEQAVQELRRPAIIAAEVQWGLHRSTQ